MQRAPVIVWFRRDLRLIDHAALSAAAETGCPIIPVFVHDETVERLGAAPKWRLGLGVRVFSNTLEENGSRLVLRRGTALAEIQRLVAETKASAVFWTRGYDGNAVARDTRVKSALNEAGITAQSFPGATLFEPWQVKTVAGRPYSVFSPFWRAIRNRDVAAANAAPSLSAPSEWPTSDTLADWRMGSSMQHGAAVISAHANVGEAAAMARLGAFLNDRLDTYTTDRDFPARDATSGLSENLAWGEISPATIWRAVEGELREGRPGAEKFLSELAWRDFAWHLMYHAPSMDSVNWRDDWDSFPWRSDNADAEKWRRGMTGEPFVDAAMRELYVTGRMHNRARMVAASYLTKHLLTDWRVGAAWFAECLTDWDPASNAMGWQWVAGSGPDAAPFFRIFNPRTQGEKFDPDGQYRAKYIAEGYSRPTGTALSFFDAAPRSWGLNPAQTYPGRTIDLGAGRTRALAAYKERDAAGAG